ncbi:MAG TPA: allophanate hydrolase subunit 1 [Actinospica sp.]|nr:allophanate hydrolase subunit 1 [Actinospica sp.]
MSAQASGPRVLPAGDRAVLLEFDSAQQVAAAHELLTARAAPGVLELVPAARTILVHYDPASFSLDGLALRPPAAAVPVPVPAAAAAAAADAGEAAAGPGFDLVTIPVVYDGPDLADLSARTGLSVAEIVERHAAPVYVVAFCGFSPGFGYLTGLDPLLRLPRRSAPRTRVPAGSVAIADEFAGVYPAASPGGWHLLGRTDARLWDLERDPPALLAPGTRVRFEAVDPA